MPFRLSQSVIDLYQECETIRSSSRQVYLISRFDDDDRTLNVCWDASYSQASRNYLIDDRWYYGEVRKLAPEKVDPGQLLDAGGRPVRGKAGVIKGFKMAESPMQGGGHAEEYFLRRLMAHLEQGYVPESIEIYVSRIPCPDTSMMWQFYFAGGRYSLPAGCGPKLYLVISTLHRIEWTLAYGEGNRSASAQSASLAHINRINRLDNATAGHISSFV